MKRFGRWFAWGTLAAVGVVLTTSALVVAEEARDFAEGAELTVGEPPAADVVSEGAGPALSVRDVAVERDGNGRRVRITLSRGAAGLRDFALDGPPRVVLDVDGPLDGATLRERRYPVSDAVVSRVRAAAHGGRLRVVLDLKKSIPVTAVRQEGNVLVAELGEIQAAAAAPAGVEPVALEMSESTPLLSPMVLAASEVVPEPVEPAVVVDAPAADEPRDQVDAAPPADDRQDAVAREIGTPVEDAPVRVAQAAPAGRDVPPPVPTPVDASTGSEGDGGLRSVAPKRSRQQLAPDPSPLFRGERISLDFKDADILNVLRVLADVSGLNIVATDDVKGRVTLHLKDVPWDQALDLVMRTNRLEANHEGNIVRISSVNRLREEREALRAAEDAEQELEPLRVRYLRVNYARADEALVDKVKGVLTDRGSVTFDDRTNTVIVRDIASGVADASNLIQQLDVQSPQVLIEANIVEATEDFARGLGVQWGYAYAAGPATGNPTGMNFPGTVGVGGGTNTGAVLPPNGSGGLPQTIPMLADFPVPANFGGGFGAGAASALNLALGSLDGTQALAARLTALEEEGKGKVISRPRVITMNNVAATIQSLTILRVKLPSTGTVINTGAGGAAGAQSTATEKINTGITLVVTPQISADGFILLSIYAKSSQPDFSRAVDGIPSEISREANSNVLIRDGETVVLGGIYRNTATDNETGLPYLRSIPGIGWLFKRTLKTDRNEELLVFLSPRIVATGGSVLPSADELWQQRDRNG